MNRTAALFRWPFLFLTFGVVIALPSSRAQSDDATPQTQDEKKKQIDEIEKKIADLKKQADDLKKVPDKATKPGEAAPTPTKAPVEGTIPDAASRQISWRSIGPANMSGRIVALSVVENDPATYWVATASGGLLKTINNGTTFEHQFDKQATVSVGDVAHAPSNPSIVYVGTGENNPRNSVSYGDGVYKSTDGGKTWKHVGLKQSFQVGKVVVHPTNPEIVYVGALGRLYGPNEERGLFKSEDGGKTWNKVLYVDDKTGVIDFRMDPFDPNTLVVGMWNRKRDEYDGFFGATKPDDVPDQYGPVVTHGPGGGIFKTTDAGKTWKKVNDPKENNGNGLPTVKTGRIGLDFSKKTKGVVYAIIDTENVGKGNATPAIYMGIVAEDVKDVGIRVESVTEGGPSEKAGFKAGDVIATVDGKKYEDNEKMMEYIRAKKPGDKVLIIVKRDGKDVPIDLILGVRPEDAEAAAAQGGGGRGGRGGQGGGRGAGGAAGAAGGAQGANTILMPGFTPAVGIGEPVTVEKVPAGGPVEKAGIKPGALVTAVNGVAVEDFRGLLAELRVGARTEDPRKAGDKVKITFKQEDKETILELALVETELQLPGGGQGGGRGANAARPNGMGLGGQRPNVQDRQGKDGYQTGGVYMSKDSGSTWTRVNSLNPRPMYFSQIRVDPTDEKNVYVLADTGGGGGNSAGLYRTTDSGKTFSQAPVRGVHADLHAFWIDPANAKHMLVGCDGGTYCTYDRGETWDHLNHVAIGQFYHVAVDNKRPYRAYGGLQDNGSWGIPTATLRARSGPYNEDAVYISGGDGFVCRVDPNDPDLVYAESQGGAISWRNLRTGAQGGARPGAGGGGGGGGGGRGGGEALRFNWNTPYILSSHNASIFYSAGQYVYRSVNKGTALKKISPDITRTKNGSATALAESPKNPDVLYVGSDDGYLWVTKDGGLNWKNVTENLAKAGVPGPRCVATLEPSRERESKCYVALDGHRSNDDKPYVLMTDDFGATWKNLSNNLPEFGSTRCVREDYKNPSVLYCGTEFGAFVSANKGASWTKFGGNLPTVAVHEFAQPTVAEEIVIATHGRSLWVTDVSSIRQMKPEVFKEAVTLFTPAPAVKWRLGAGGESPYSETIRKFVGQNPPRGTAIDYYLKSDAKSLSLKVFDASNKLVSEFTTAPKSAGFHHLQWTLTRGQIGGTQGGGGRGGFQGGGGGGGRGGLGGGGAILAGTYRVTLTVDGKEFSQGLTVENDPSAPPGIGTSEEVIVAIGEEDEEEEEKMLEELKKLLSKFKDD